MRAPFIHKELQCPQSHPHASCTPVLMCEPAQCFPSPPCGLVPAMPNSLIMPGFAVCFTTFICMSCVVTQPPAATGVQYGMQTSSPISDHSESPGSCNNTQGHTGGLLGFRHLSQPPSPLPLPTLLQAPTSNIFSPTLHPGGIDRS